MSKRLQFVFRINSTIRIVCIISRYVYMNTLPGSGIEYAIHTHRRFQVLFCCRTQRQDILIRIVFIMQQITLIILRSRFAHQSCKSIDIILLRLYNLP